MDRTVEIPPYTFRERREGEGTPVILLHGLGGSADWWRRNIEPLAEDHEVVAVSLPGFLALSFADVASLLIRWIESSFREPVHLVGNSMGGHIALHVAAQRPDLVRSLTLVDATGIPFELKPGLHLEHLFVPRGAFSFATILARDAFRTGPRSLALAFARLLHNDARPLMAQVKMPVLLLWGEHDPLVPLAYGQQIASAIPHAKLVVIPKAGHIPMWENAEAFNQALRTFLNEVDRLDFERTSPRIFSWGFSGWTNGIAHREAGRRRDIVLIHGLGMSSLYFVRFANALYAQGWNPIAPDLPGFGESANAPAASPEEHAQLLAGWADALGIRGAVWLGHSIGCNAVAHLAALRPDLVRTAVMMGPLWTRRATLTRLFAMLALDALREPLLLYRYVIPAYWRTGMWRWWRTIRRYAPDLKRQPPEGIMVAGSRDPLPDRRRVKVIEVTGAHACHFSNPEESATFLRPYLVASTVTV
jgi:pimeloyl-ACP methyl ester carboxylesterase